MKIKFVVYGDPMGKQRPKFSTNNGYVRTYTPKETETYESKVVNAFKSVINPDVLDKPIFEPKQEVWATITAYYKLQKEHYKKLGINQKGLDKLNGLINPTQKPDCDNIAKICLDALNGIAYYDDSQVIGLCVIKRYAEAPRVEITLESELK